MLTNTYPVKNAMGIVNTKLNIDRSVMRYPVIMIIVSTNTLTHVNSFSKIESTMSVQ
jgi:hypothetical protein